MSPVTARWSGWHVRVGRGPMLHCLSDRCVCDNAPSLPRCDQRRSRFRPCGCAMPLGASGQTRSAWCARDNPDSSLRVSARKELISKPTGRSPNPGQKVDLPEFRDRRSVVPFALAGSVFRSLSRLQLYQPNLSVRSPLRSYARLSKRACSDSGLCGRHWRKLHLGTWASRVGPG